MRNRPSTQRLSCACLHTCSHHNAEQNAAFGGVITVLHVLSGSRSQAGHRYPVSASSVRRYLWASSRFAMALAAQAAMALRRETRRKAELKEKYAKLRAQEGASAAPAASEQPSG